MAILPTDAVFAPTSFWYQQIPTVVPLHPNSANFAIEFRRQRYDPRWYGPNVGINTSSYTSPIYYPEHAGGLVETGGLVKVQAVKPVPAYGPLTAQWATVPIPSYAIPAPGTDSEMTIWDRPNDTIYEWWQAKHLADGSWTGRWGGRMASASTSDGIWPAPYGATATGLPFLGGQITAEELSRGEIKHVMGIALPECAKLLSWPALRGDGQHTGPNYIPQGMRFRLDPTVNLDALQWWSPAGKVIARAAQKYGFVVWDKAGAIVLRANGRNTYVNQPNPYPALLGGVYGAYLALSAVPWDRLQFMPMNYGKPPIAVTPSTKRMTK